MLPSDQQILVSAPIPAVAEQLAAAFRDELAAAKLSLAVRVIISRDPEATQGPPSAIVVPDGVFYRDLNPEHAREIVREHIVGGQPFARCYEKRVEGAALEAILSRHGFYRLQHHLVLRRSGMIDPTSIDDYIASEGYEALAKALHELGAQAVISVIQKAELRGRGGAGFPTGMKWRICADEPGTRKYVVCNADEGDPGAFMDRAVLESDPHAIVEAMAICGFAIGAREGYVYVRAEYPLAIERLGKAINDARERGMLGERILGSDAAFNLEIRIGAGAFVCGEETALMRSIEGQRGSPRCKPPFPVQAGLFGKPTVLNNVETFANVPPIILHGAEAFAQHGEGRSRGTKVFALAGHVNNTGLVEVPMGITLGEIVQDLGGGIPGGKHFKAAQIGGPSGGCLPAKHLNTPLTYESLPSLGAIMGSGGLIIMNEDTCMVDLARYFLEFIQDESCGKCTPCRIGTKLMLDTVTRITSGKGTHEDLQQLEKLAQHIATSSLCGLGQTAPNPVLSTLRYFRDEYLEHIERKHCRAGSCRALIHAPCSNACPASVNVPAYLAYAAEERWDEALRVHLRNNPFPSVCGRVCPQWCIEKCRRADLEGPLAIRAVKRYLADSREDYTDLFPPKKPANGHRIAIVGAGPAGLSCAYYLVLLGYEVTVFERHDEPGGMMRYAIPAYRLPREILASEITNLVKLGVEIRTGIAVGEELTLKELKKEGYEAFFIATGASKERLPRVSGIDLPGVIPGIRFLDRIARGEQVALGRRIMIVGGGDVAIDCSRVAQRHGADEITIVYRRTREEMPTSPIEIAEAEVEGVRVELLSNLVSIERGAGEALRVVTRRYELGDFDEGGRRRPVPISGSETTREIDSLIIAIGQVPEVEDVILGTSLEHLGHQLAANRTTGATAAPEIFAGGDLVSGSATVIEAIAAGQHAARSIDQLIHPGETDYFWEHLELPEVEIDFDREISEHAPVEYPLLSPEERFVTVEVEKTISQEQASREAKRCLRCDFHA